MSDDALEAGEPEILPPGVTALAIRQIAVKLLGLEALVTIY